MSFSQCAGAETGPQRQWGESGPVYSSSSPMVTPLRQLPTRSGDLVLSEDARVGGSHPLACMPRAVYCVMDGLTFPD